MADELFNPEKIVYESELQTRLLRINVSLEESGWKVKDRSMVVEEVDTRQSDFKVRDYKTVDETLKNDRESKYADYLLLDKKGDPLAVVEAKRTSKDPIIGKTQAREYAGDIKNQTGKDVFVFLTNGYEIWFWNLNYENPRMISGFFNQDDLERIQWQNFHKRKFSDIKINENIINRPYQIEAVKRVLEGIEKGKRRFLIVHATGTGKTRVAMALIDILRRSNRVEKVLFLADRKALRNQAYDEGFKVFLPEESKDKIFSGKINKKVNLYASTIQTLMECYREFSPGDFDLIISDEAHRSIYNKWKDVFTYFDAVKIGLTATPSDSIDRDTFRFFECEDNKPTALYTYEDAVKDGWLADFKVQQASTHFQIEGISPMDIPSEIKNKLSKDGIEEESLFFEGTDIEKKVVVTGTNEVIIKEFMDNCLDDQTGTLPAKSIIFAVSKKHAKRLYEAFERLYPQHKGRLAEIITSDDSRAQDLMKSFKQESYPRIAISVDMLDTGVNIPEVCNLVFAKPVFSKIKFWQMIGRGTRADDMCKHKDWLPNGKKEYFLIFDFWKNMEWFDLHPEGKEASSTEALPSKIFLTIIRQYEFFLKNNDNIKAEMLKSKLIASIKALPADSISIKEKAREIELATSGKLWDKMGVNPLDFLRNKIAPLMKFQTDVNINIASFTLKVEKLILAILNRDKETINIIGEDICYDIGCLPNTINDVKQKEKILDKITNKSFWENITFEDAVMILEEVAPLMKYKRVEPAPKINLDIGDFLQQRKLIEFGPLPEQEYIEVYKQKIENRIKELAESHPTIMKIKNNEILTEADLQELEKTLNSPGLYITEETLRDVYEPHKGTLVQFVKETIGLYGSSDPKKRIAEAFKTFMIEKNYLNADQVNFMRTLQTIFTAKHHVLYQDLFEPPLTNIGNAPIPLFTKDELMDVLNLCGKLEAEVFS